jgi:hypothetical protein
MTVQPVHRLSVEAVERGFVCSYAIGLTVDLPEFMKKLGASDPTAATINQFVEGMLKFAKDIRKDRFELSDHGWWSPTLRQKMAQAAAAQKGL